MADGEWYYAKDNQQQGPVPLAVMLDMARGGQLRPAGYYPAVQQQYPPGAVPNYLVQAILVTLFCCIPFGIVSIVYAAQVNDKLMRWDYAGAVDSSQKAKT